MKELEINPIKTYATRENAIKAVEKAFPNHKDMDVWYQILERDNRYFPVFFGESAVDHCIHFKFNVVAVR